MRSIQQVSNSPINLNFIRTEIQQVKKALPKEQEQGLHHAIYENRILQQQNNSLLKQVHDLKEKTHILQEENKRLVSLIQINQQQENHNQEIAAETINKLKNDKDTLLAQLKQNQSDHTNELNSAKQELLQLAQELRKAWQDNDSMNLKYNYELSKIKKEEVHQTSGDSEIDVLQRRLAGAQKEAYDYQLKNAALIRQFEDFSIQLTKKSNIGKIIRRRHSESQAKHFRRSHPVMIVSEGQSIDSEESDTEAMNNLQEQINMLNEEIGEYEENQKYYQQEMERFRQNYSQELEKRQEIEGYYKIAYEQVQRNAMQEEEFQNQIQEQNLKINELDAVINILQDKNEDLQNQVKIVNDENFRLINQLEESPLRVNLNLQELDKNDNNEFQDMPNINDLISEIQQQRGQIQHAEAMISQIQREKLELQKEKEQLQNQLTTLADQVTKGGQQKLFLELKNENNELKKQLSGSSPKNEYFAKVDQFNKLIQDLYNQITDLKQLNTELENQIDSQAKELELYQKVKPEVNQQISAEELNKKQQLIVILQQKLQNALNANLQNQENISDLNQKLEIATLNQIVTENQDFLTQLDAQESNLEQQQIQSDNQIVVNFLGEQIKQQNIEIEQLKAKLLENSQAKDFQENQFKKQIQNLNAQLQSLPQEGPKSEVPQKEQTENDSQNVVNLLGEQIKQQNIEIEQLKAKLLENNQAKDDQENQFKEQIQNLNAQLQSLQQEEPKSEVPLQEQTENDSQNVVNFLGEQIKQQNIEIEQLKAKLLENNQDNQENQFKEQIQNLNAQLQSLQQEEPKSEVPQQEQTEKDSKNVVNFLGEQIKQQNIEIEQLKAKLKQAIESTKEDEEKLFDEQIQNLNNQLQTQRQEQQDEGQILIKENESQYIINQYKEQIKQNQVEIEQHIKKIEKLNEEKDEQQKQLKEKIYNLQNQLQQIQQTQQLIQEFELQSNVKSQEDEQIEFKDEVPIELQESNCYQQEQTLENQLESPIEPQQVNVEELTQQLKDLQELYKESQEKNQYLEQTLTNIEQLMNNLKQTLNNSQQEIVQLKDQLGSQQNINKPELDKDVSNSKMIIHSQSENILPQYIAEINAKDENTFENERDALKQQIRILEDNVRELRQQCEKMQDILRMNTTNAQQLQDEIKQQNEELIKVRNEKSELNDQYLTQMKSQFNESDQLQIQSLRQKNQSDNKIQELEEIIDNKTDELKNYSQLQAENEELKEKINQMHQYIEQENSNDVKVTDQLIEEIKKLQKYTDEVENTHQKELAYLRRFKEDSDFRENEISRGFMELNKRILNLHKENNELREYKKLYKQCIMQEKQLFEYEYKIKQMGEGISLLNQKIIWLNNQLMKDAEKVKKYDILLTERAYFERQVQDSRLTRESIDQGIVQLNQKIIDLTSANFKQSKQLERQKDYLYLKKQMEFNQYQVNQMNEGISSQNQKLLKLHQDQQQNQDQMEQQLKECEELKLQLQKQEIINSKQLVVMENFTELEFKPTLQENQRLKSKIEQQSQEQQKQLSDDQDQIKSLIEDIKGLQEQLLKAQKMEDQQTNLIKQNESEIIELKLNVKQLIEQNQTMRVTIEELQDQVDHNIQFTNRNAHHSGKAQTTILKSSGYSERQELVDKVYTPLSVNSMKSEGAKTKEEKQKFLKSLYRSAGISASVMSVKGDYTTLQQVATLADERRSQKSETNSASSKDLSQSYPPPK